MSKVTIDLEPEQIKQAFEQLNTTEKIKLIEELERETLRIRWKMLLSEIDKRLKKFPISKADINKEIAEYRKEKYAKGCN